MRVRIVEGLFWLVVIITVTVTAIGIVLDLVVPDPVAPVGWNALSLPTERIPST